jgi:molybdopterin-guanine dinucleotide biosynthesis protein A
MGTDKALLELAGRPLAAWVADALAAVADDVVVAGRRDLLGHKGMPDPVSPFQGPLSGLSACLALGEPLLAVAVDQPWVRRRTLQALIDAAATEALVPVDQGVRQITCAYYPPGLAELAVAELAGGGSVQSLLDLAGFIPVLEGEWREWGEDGRSWFSVDRPQDLAEGLSRYGLPG